MRADTTESHTIGSPLLSRKAFDVRNKLVHPREAVDLTAADVERYLKAIVEALNNRYLAVFGRGHQSYGRGLQSTVTF